MSSNKIEISVKDIPEIIKVLEEAEKEIEFERKSKNLFIDDLYKVCEISLKQNKEIERLHSIIKEVREWANKTIFYFDFEEEITKYAFDLLYTKQGRELLEILEKEN